MAIYNQLLGTIIPKNTVITRATEETHKNSKTVRGDIYKLCHLLSYISEMS